jgi:hypothetical protein
MKQKLLILAVVIFVTAAITNLTVSDAYRGIVDDITTGPLVQFEMKVLRSGPVKKGPDLRKLPLFSVISWEEPAVMKVKDADGNQKTLYIPFVRHTDDYDREAFAKTVKKLRLDKGIRVLIEKDVPPYFDKDNVYGYPFLNMPALYKEYFEKKKKEEKLLVVVEDYDFGKVHTPSWHTRNLTDVLDREDLIQVHSCLYENCYLSE